MARVPMWSLQEFITVLENPNLSDDDLAALLGPVRNSNAVSWVRGGVCSWHKGNEVSMLNRIMKDYLARQDRPQYTCPCGAVV